jgi:hypothetical protein
MWAGILFNLCETQSGPVMHIKNARKTVRLGVAKIGLFMSVYLQKYAKIEPHIMPFAAPYSRSGSGHFHQHSKTHPGREMVSKRVYVNVLICPIGKIRLIWGYFKTGPDTGFFLS